MGHLLEGRAGHHVQQFMSGLPTKPVLFKWPPLQLGLGSAPQLLFGLGGCLLAL